MNEFININYDKPERPTVSGRELHEKLEIKEKYADWFKRMADYGFTEGVDFNQIISVGGFSEISEKPKAGGRPSIDHELTIGMAKEICMLQRSEMGRMFRQHFIKCEELLKKILEERQKTEIERAKGLFIRNMFTDTLKQSGEDERMHGHAYSTYTDLIYRSLFGIPAKKLREYFGVSKSENLRDCFAKEELALIKSREHLVSGLMDMGWGYEQIKEFVMNKSNFKIEFENRFIES